MGSRSMAMRLAVSKLKWLWYMTQCSLCLKL